MCTGACRIRKGIGSSGAGVRMVMSHLMWVLGTELVSSTGVVCTLNCRDISLAPENQYFSERNELAYIHIIVNVYIYIECMFHSSHLYRMYVPYQSR